MQPKSQLKLETEARRGVESETRIGTEMDLEVETEMGWVRDRHSAEIKLREDRIRGRSRE